MTDIINRSIFFTHFPIEIKAFYVKRDPSDLNVTESVDVLMSGVEEIMKAVMRTCSRGTSARELIRRCTTGTPIRGSEHFIAASSLHKGEEHHPHRYPVFTDHRPFRYGTSLNLYPVLNTKYRKRSGPNSYLLSPQYIHSGLSNSSRLLNPPLLYPRTSCSPPRRIIEANAKQLGPKNEAWSTGGILWKMANETAHRVSELRRGIFHVSITGCNFMEIPATSEFSRYNPSCFEGRYRTVS